MLCYDQVKIKCDSVIFHFLSRTRNADWKGVRGMEEKTLKTEKRIAAFAKRSLERRTKWQQEAEIRGKYRRALKSAELPEQDGAGNVTLHFSGEAEARHPEL